MINLLRADMYRIFRGKGIYITFAVMLAIIILTIFVFREAPVAGVSPEIVIEDFEFADRQLGETTITGAISAQMAVGAMNNMVYFFLPLIVIAVMATFSSGAVKNEISVGISRVKFYFSKWLLAAGLSVLFMLVYFALSVIFAIIVGGTGYWGDGLVAEIAKAFGLQTILTLGFVSLGVFFGFVTRRSAAVIGLYIALTLVPSIVISILMGAFPRAIEVFQYELFGMYFFFASPGLLTNFELWRSIAVGLAYIILPTLAGVLIFKKAEIK